MNSNDKQLQRVENKIFNKFVNKIRRFLFDRNAISEEKKDVKNDFETVEEIDLKEELKNLENEYIYLIREKEKTKEELDNIVLKDLRITLRIYELEEKELNEIKELIQKELEDIKKH